MNKAAVFLLLSVLAAPLLDAQTAAGRLKPAAGSGEVPPQISRQTGLFFANVQNNNMRDGYVDLFNGTWQAAVSVLVGVFVEMSTKTVGKFGNIDSFELIDSRAFGTRLLDVAYLTRHHDKFYRWQFIYQAVGNGNWLLTNMAVDDLRALLPAYPASLPPPDDIQIRMEKFFLALQNRAVDDAFRELVKGSPLAGSAEQTAAFIAKTKLAFANYGAMNHYELFDHRPLGKGLRLLTYFNTLDLQTLRWQFIFTVDARGQWTLLTIRLDDQIAAGIINSN
jgi:hypothetical protein